VAAFVGLTVLVIVLYGVPRAYVVADLVRAEEQARVDRTADLAALVLEQRVAAHVRVSSAYLDSLAEKGERIVLVPASGPRVVSSGAAPAPDDVSATRQVPSGGHVTVSRTGAAVSARISQAVLPLILLGLLLVVLAAGVGFVLARRLARPFQELATVARDLGIGRLHPDVPAYRVPEARAIGQALAVSGEQLDAILRRERQVAVHASHELRTPVTALRLDLEDLALWPETPPSVAAELRRCTTELDRLSAAIGDLLALAQERRTGAEIDLDLDALVAETVARLGDRDGVHAVVDRAGPLPTHLEPLPVVQLLELLIQDAQSDGPGDVRVGADDLGSHLEIRVTPADPGGTPAAGERWELATAIAASVGGQLAREAATGVTIIRLPKRPVTVRAASDG
jgi:signal transduction histidine kinase